MNITDEQLTGYIDAELTVAEMAEVKAALSQDPNLRARHDALKAATQGLQADMAALLSTAPKMPPLPPEAAMTGAPTAWMGGALAACAAALVATTIWITQPTQRDWMTEVASYQALYVNETLASLPDQPDGVVAEISGRIGRSLEGATDVTGLDYRRTQLLGYEGTDLVQMAYLTVDGQPMAFCLIRNEGDTAQISTAVRQGLASAAWADEDHAYLLIGGSDLTAVESFAKEIQSQL